ncbi:uncharacterized protein FA14DRAFT_15133 [Meira miltonrushii]|uniref:Small ribosomal subunit protein uS5m n=1 Tax=Meira miltonrushii TaxID=1280837 RepID=A0A316VIU3_9BASI|nr:uncharacterized protein FA14DRAFT_15133 [Meira miltonrushii]PWN37522.1 hypothetical protein FA14DRAFT_15133 [Meira miltonrushii]
MLLRHEGARLLNLTCKNTQIAPKAIGSRWSKSASFSSSSFHQTSQEQGTSIKSSADTQQPSSSSSSSSAVTTNRKPSPLQFDIESFPSLLHEPHPVLDAYERWDVRPSSEAPFPSSVTFFNSPKYFAAKKPSAAAIIQSGGDGDGDDIDSAAYLSSVTPLSKGEVNGIHRHLLKIRRVTQQTGKGRFSRMSALVVAGNGRGMVGYGDGKDINVGNAARKAFHAAVKNMDYVERFNGHTIPAEVTGKWSSTRVTLRPRPHGFGLRVPPVIHAIARSAGITDMSAAILGSTNPINVAKATLALLWGGSAPQGLGDGIGGPMRRVDRGVGMRTVQDIELARGRRLRQVDLSNDS